MAWLVGREHQMMLAKEDSKKQVKRNRRAPWQSTPLQYSINEMTVLQVFKFVGSGG